MAARERGADPRVHAVKILVTGSEGFVGRHVCAMVEHAGHEALGWDVGAEAVWKDAPLPKVDAAVLLAAVGGVELTQRNPAFVIQNNFDAAMRWRHLECPIVLVSSFSVYGNGLAKYQVRFDANTAPAPADAYGASKLMQELVFAGKPNVWTLRPSSMYGPGLDLQNPQTIAARMVAWCLRRRKSMMVDPFPFDEDGQQTRDFLFVLDLVDLIQEILFPDPREEARHPRTLCVSSGRELSLTEALKSFAFAANVVPSWKCNGQKKSPMRRCVGDPTEAERILGRTMTQLAEGACAVFS